ncbi:DUF6957 family protein [Marinimicrobium sp. C2-29]|uniref:DUF6957 family protein n=1 Tax=Marinimicrobium sp. C2-29 TaxID=3139825 RepID=UPI003138E022
MIDHDYAAYLVAMNPSCCVSTDLGCDRGFVSQIQQKAARLRPNMPTAVVADWIWIDIYQNIPENGNDPETLLDSFVLAYRLLQDDSDRGFRGVITTSLQEVLWKCLFVTRNTHYILCGSGKRATVYVEESGGTVVLATALHHQDNSKALKSVH